MTIDSRGIYFYSREMRERYQAWKRIAVSVVLTDPKGNILLVRPKYKDGWILPGGVAEREEAPSEAIMREVESELGIEISPKKLLCVDYRGSQDEYIMFLFDGGAISLSQVSRIRYPKEKFSDLRFVSIREAQELLRENAARRLAAIVREKHDAHHTVYLEHEQFFRRKK